ncbi:MAG TPA: carbohydrate kinase family protein [Candidatus Acidoferrum sp.]|jgi:ribokinase|nr:carbohydrate kinase family protein [Candidatus Acidoferrum sp.]
MKTFDVALFGPVFIDHVFTGLERLPGPGEEIFATGYCREAGGGCINTACGIAKLGALSTCFGLMGRHDSQWLIERVRSFGVTTEHVRYSELPTGVTVSASLAGDRSFLTYDGANESWTQWLESPGLPELLAMARHVHFACPLPPEAGLRIIRRLHVLGSTVSLDVGWQDNWLRNAEVWPFLAELDWFLPNEKEASLMTRQTDVDEVFSVCAHHGVNRLVIKLGASGAAMRNRGATIRSSAIAASVVDTTGAGDAFNAGFIHAFLAGLPDQTCLERGIICGSLSTRQAGSLAALPDLSEVLKYHDNEPKR